MSEPKKSKKYFHTRTGYPPVDYLSAEYFNDAGLTGLPKRGIKTEQSLQANSSRKQTHYAMRLSDG